MKLRKMILLVLALFIVACTNYKNLTNALAPGMTKQEVVNVMGNPYEKSIDGKKETYYYTSGSGTFRTQAKISFDENGHLEKAYSY